MGTISEEISSLRGRIDEAYEAVRAKGGEIPATTDSWNLPEAISSIPANKTVPVEWIESTGEQFITMPFPFSNQINSRGVMEIDAQVVYDEDLSGNQDVFGYLEWNGSSYVFPCFQWQLRDPHGAHTANIQLGGSALATSWTTQPFIRNKLIFDLASQGSYQGLLYASITRPETYTTALPPALFAAQRSDGQVLNKSHVRLFRVTHRQGSVVMADLVPVRHGTEGCLLDLVSGKLLKNEGEGSFIVGPDIDFQIPGAQRVEYIQFDKTQWIDTGTKGNQDTYVEADCALTAIPGHPELVIGWRQSATSRNMSLIYGLTGASMDFGDYTQTRLTQEYSLIPATSRRTLVTSSGLRYSIPHLMDRGMSFSQLANQAAYTGADFQTENLLVGHAGAGYSSAGIGDFSGRLWHVKIENKGQIQRDMWPCRIGDVGCMFDRVSGQFFYSQGGPFIVGPDI